MDAQRQEKRFAAGNSRTWWIMIWTVSGYFIKKKMP